MSLLHLSTDEEGKRSRLAREKRSSELVPCETHHVGTRAVLGLTSERVQSKELGPPSCAELAPGWYQPWIMLGPDPEPWQWWICSGGVCPGLELLCSALAEAGGCRLRAHRRQCWMGCFALAKTTSPP